MKNFFTKALFSLLSLASTLVYGGNGSSGGGYITGNEVNPWFLHNTKTVSYCIEVAPEFSDIPKDKLAPMIEDAFAYWKKVFSLTEAYYSIGESEKLDLRLGTQDFKQVVTCADSTDLKFQFGFMTEEQKGSWPKPSQLLAGAFRTSYDEVNLKGEGVIYIAPERGPLRPRARKFHPKPWSFGSHNALRLTLTHEIGHIFGLQDDHYSSGLMSARFVQLLTARESVESIEDWVVKSIASPFGCNDNLEAEYYSIHDVAGDEELRPHVSSTKAAKKSGRLSGGIDDILGLPDYTESYTLYFLTRDREMKISLNGQNYARIVFSPQDFLMGVEEDAIQLLLTDQQKVFKGIDPDEYDVSHTIYDKYVSGQIWDVTLELANGKTLPVNVDFDQACHVEISTVYEGKLIHIID